VQRVRGVAEWWLRGSVGVEIDAWFAGWLYIGYAGDTQILLAGGRAGREGEKVGEGGRRRRVDPVR